MAISTKSLYEAFKPREEEVLEDIIRIARLDSNSKEPLNIRKCGEELRKMAEEYLHVSAIEEFPSHYDEAKHMYFEVGNGPRRIFCIGHYDTVWPEGSLGIRREGDRLYGPGVYDMKGGLVLMFWALRHLVDNDLLGDRTFCCFMDCDEETGSFSSKEHFMKKAEEVVPCEYQGEAMTIGFNDEKLVEILTNISGDIVVLKLLDPTRAGIFLPGSQPEGEDLLMLLMPMML